MLPRLPKRVCESGNMTLGRDFGVDISSPEEVVSAVFTERYLRERHHATRFAGHVMLPRYFPRENSLSTCCLGGLRHEVWAPQESRLQAALVMKILKYPQARKAWHAALDIRAPENSHGDCSKRGYAQCQEISW